MTEVPHRRFEITITVGADEWDDAVRDVESIARELLRHGKECSSVMGGYSGNHTVQVVERPEMTHDVYCEALDRYLERAPVAPRG